MKRAFKQAARAARAARSQDTWSLFVAFAMLCALLYSVGNGGGLGVMPEAQERKPANAAESPAPSHSPQARAALHARMAAKKPRFH